MYLILKAPPCCPLPRPGQPTLRIITIWFHLVLSDTGAPLGFGDTIPEPRIRAQVALLNQRFRPVGFIFALGGITRDIVGPQFYENQGVAVGDYPPEVVDVRGRQRRGGLRDLNVFIVGPETIEGGAGFGASSWLVDVLNGTDPCQDYVLLPVSALAPSRARSSKVVNLQGTTDFVAIGDDGSGGGASSSFAQRGDGSGDGGDDDGGSGGGGGGGSGFAQTDGDIGGGDGGGDSGGVDESSLGGDDGNEDEESLLEFRLPGAIGVFAVQGNILAHQVNWEGERRKGGRRRNGGGEGRNE